MTNKIKTSGRCLIAGAAVLSMAAIGAAQPAQARGGDITKGVIMGLAAGVAIDQLSRNHFGNSGYTTSRRYYAPSQPTYVYPQSSYDSDSSYYYPRTSYTRSYYAPRYTTPSYSAPSSPASRAFNSQDRQLRISIQYKLMQQGFYNASLDGLWGPSTQRALYDYARSNGQLSMLTSEQESNQLFGDILR